MAVYNILVMSIQSFIEKISEKPPHIRKRYSLAISFAFTAIIFIFWISSFGFVRIPSDGTMASVVEKVDSPGRSLVASVGSFFVDIKEIFFGPKKVIYSSVEVVPGRK